MNQPVNAEVTKEITLAVLTSENPLVIGLAFVVAVIILILVGSPFVARAIKTWKEANSDGQVDDARKVLFEQLQIQVKQNGEDIRMLVAEKRELEQETSELRKEVQRLTSMEELVEKLKTRLSEKDEMIEKLRDDISRRDEYERIRNIEFAGMKDKIHELEMRLARDEISFCQGCEYHPAHGQGV